MNHLTCMIFASTKNVEACTSLLSFHPLHMVFHLLTQSMHRESDSEASQSLVWSQPVHVSSKSSWRVSIMSDTETAPLASTLSRGADYSTSSSFAGNSLLDSITAAANSLSGYVPMCDLMMHVPKMPDLPSSPVIRIVMSARYLLHNKTDLPLLCLESMATRTRQPPSTLLEPGTTHSLLIGNSLHLYPQISLSLFLSFYSSQLQTSSLVLHCVTG